MMGLDPESIEFSADSDERLVHLVLSLGSEAAFRALYARHASRLYRIARRMLGSNEDAEDVMQDTWMRACDQLARFEWRATFGTWLTSIAVNVARDILARRGRWVDVELEEQMIYLELDKRAEHLDIERAIASLPAGCRTAFILHDIEGYTHEEIAEQLGYTEGTSKTQVFRARRALRRLLGSETEVEESRNGKS